MKITVLGSGTSQGVPVIACECKVCTSSDPKDYRRRCSIFVEYKNTKIIIDTGPDFREQMLRSKVKALDAVVITHEHKDHVAGLDDVRAFNFIQKKKMDVFASERVQSALKKEFEYIFSDYKYPGIPEIELQTIDTSSFVIGDIELIPIDVMHHKLPVKGFRIQDFAYITDANYISETEKEKLKSLDVLILNSLRKEKHASHFNLEDALDLVAELQPKKVYFTHISHLMGTHKETEAILPENVRVAYDGLELNL